MFEIEIVDFIGLPVFTFAKWLQNGYNAHSLARQIPQGGTATMFCNFDCASLLKLLCGFFGKC